MQSMHVDHVLPEHLLDDPERLKEVIDSFGLPEDFDLNSYENWLPSCGPCNLRKRGEVFEPVPLIKLQLQKAAEKAAKAKTFEEAAVHSATLTKSINTMCRANERTILTLEHFEPIVASLKEHNPELLEGVYEFVASQRKDVMGFAYQKFKPAEIPLTPFHKVLMEDEWKVIVTAPYGTGYIPKGDNIDGSFYCGFCGSLGPWSGARCLSCGHLNDD